MGRMGATWAKLEPSWQQVAAKMGRDSDFGIRLGGFGGIWEAF